MSRLKVNKFDSRLFDTKVKPVVQIHGTECLSRIGLKTGMFAYRIRVMKYNDNPLREDWITVASMTVESEEAPKLIKNIRDSIESQKTEAGFMTLKNVIDIVEDTAKK